MTTCKKAKQLYHTKENYQIYINSEFIMSQKDDLTKIQCVKLIKINGGQWHTYMLRRNYKDASLYKHILWYGCSNGLALYVEKF